VRPPAPRGLWQRPPEFSGAPTCWAPPYASAGGRQSCAAQSLHSHGTNALRLFGAGGARAQAAAGFPHAIEIGLPALRLGRRLAPDDPEAARVQSFFAILASIEDTNLLYRGGTGGLRYAQEAAAGFLGQGGVEQPDWRERAAAVHRSFVTRRLSPGGCADLLAISLLLDALEAHS
jgi:triphosphoribosyl-dephospho-CoA synthase